MLVSTNPITAARRQVVRALLWQTAVTAGLAVASTVVSGARSGIAVLVGGGITMLGTAYLVLALSRQRLGGAPAGLIWDVFVSWAVKAVLVVSLLAIAFRSKQLPPSFLMAGLCGALVAYWLAMSMTGPQGPESNRGSDRDGS